jgi:hypothetical protein
MSEERDLFGELIKPEPEPEARQDGLGLSVPFATPRAHIQRDATRRAAEELRQGPQLERLQAEMERAERAAERLLKGLEATRADSKAPPAAKRCAQLEFDAAWIEFEKAQEAYGAERRGF